MDNELARSRLETLLDKISQWLAEDSRLRDLLDDRIETEFRLEKVNELFFQKKPTWDEDLKEAAGILSGMGLRSTAARMQETQLAITQHLDAVLDGVGASSRDPLDIVNFQRVLPEVSLTLAVRRLPINCLLLGARLIDLQELVREIKFQIAVSPNAAPALGSSQEESIGRQLREAQEPSIDRVPPSQDAAQTHSGLPGDSDGIKPLDSAQTIVRCAPPHHSWDGSGEGWQCGRDLDSSGYKFAPHFYRDVWLFVQHQSQKKTNGGILAELNGRRVGKPDWQFIESEKTLLSHASAVAAFMGWGFRNKKKGR